MIWFRKKKAIYKIAETNRIDVVAQKNANKEVVAQAKAATQQLRKLLDHNGFTIQIFLAAGGSIKTRTRKATK